MRFRSLGYVSLCITSMFMMACSGMGRSSIARSLASIVPTSKVDCGADTVALGGTCAPIKTMDISTQHPMSSLTLVTFPAPSSSIGYVGLKGLLAIDLDSPQIFTETLFEVGYADTCDAGTFDITSYDELSAHMTNVQFVGANIIKTNAAGHTELPIDFTLDAPVKTGGCIFIDFGADAWYRPGANPNPNITFSENLALKYVDYAPALDQSTLAFSETYGSGGEVCLGSCDVGFNATSDRHGVAQIVTRADHAFTLRALFGTLGNGPFAGDGRYSPAAVTGGWTSENIFYLDPQCSASVPGANGQMNQVPGIPPGGTLLLDIKTGGNGADSMQNIPVFQSLDQPVAEGDCLVTVFVAHSNSVIDMESQISAVIDNSSGGQSAVAGNSAQFNSGLINQLLSNPGNAAAAQAQANQNAATAAAAAAQAAADNSRSAALAATAAANAAAAAAQVTAAATAAPADAGAAIQSADTATAVATQTQTTPVYRFLSKGGRHWYALRPDAFPNQAHLEGAVFSIYVAPYPGTVGLYRCQEGPQHFLSVDSGCEGSTVVDLLGYVAASPLAGTTPLYRFDLNGDWLETVDASDGTSNGYNNATVLCSVPQ